MIIIGSTNKLRDEAERTCRGAYRAWIKDAAKSEWASWPEVLRHHPRACRTEGEEAHFPLAGDGTGIRAVVIFKPGLLRLMCVAPAPVVRRQIPLSPPSTQSKPHETQHTL